MDFTLSDEQRAISDSVRELVESATGTEQVATGQMDAYLSSALDEIGVSALLLPESSGGLGLGMVEVSLVAEALGRSGSAAPWAESIGAVPTLLAGLAPTNSAAQELSDQHAAGLSIGFATGATSAGRARCRGDRHEVVLAVVAGRLLVARSSSLRPESTRALRGALPMASFAVADAEDIGAVPEHVVQRSLASGQVASAAFLIGAGRKSLELAVDYAGARHQFDTPIGSFQAVKHMLADSEIALTMALPLVHGAAVAIDWESPTAARDSISALLTSTTAARTAARNALQVHGAIGYTDECAVGPLLSIAQSEVTAWGTISQLEAQWARSMRAAGWMRDVAAEQEAS